MDPASLSPKHPVFCDQEHRYWRPAGDFAEGVEVPGVSRILEAVGIIQLNPFHSEQGRENGANLHLCIELLNEGTLDWDSVDPLILPRLEKYATWMDERDFRPLVIEQPLYSPKYEYAGTPDVFGKLGQDFVVIDIKSGPVAPHEALKLEAYRQLISENYNIPHKSIRRMALDKLSTIKVLKERRFLDANDKAVWLGALSVFHWMRNNLRGMNGSIEAAGPPVADMAGALPAQPVHPSL